MPGNSSTSKPGTSICTAGGFGTSSNGRGIGAALQQTRQPKTAGNRPNNFMPVMIAERLLQHNQRDPMSSALAAKPDRSGNLQIAGARGKHL